MNKKFGVGIISGLVSLVLIGAVVFCAVWGYNNAARVQELMQGTNIYNKQDIDNAYQDGYDTALVNKDEYTLLISEYRDKLTVLYAEKAELEKLREPAARVPELELRISGLEESIAHYEDLLTKIGAEDFYIVNYFVGAELYASQAVKKGEKLTAVAEPAKNETFLGWSLDGKTVVDIDEIEVTSNLKLTALFEFEISVVKYAKSYQYQGVGDDVVESSATIHTNNLSTMEITEGQFLTYNDLTGEKCVLTLCDENGFYLSAPAESLDERYWYSAEGTNAYTHVTTLTDGELHLYKYKFSNTANLYDPQFVMLNFDVITGICDLLYSTYDPDGNYLEGATVKFNEFTIDNNQYSGIYTIPVTNNYSVILSAESTVKVGDFYYKAVAVIPLNANERQLYTVLAYALRDDGTTGRRIECGYGIWGYSMFTGDTSKGHLAMSYVTIGGSTIRPLELDGGMTNAN